MTEQAEAADLLLLTARIVRAQLSNRPTAATELPTLIQEVYTSLKGAGTGTTTATAKKPAVPIKRSVTDSYIICLEDGRRLKMLKRHLRSAFGMTPEQYRVKWGLPADYPMVAPNYTAQRSAIAKKFGLGRKRKPDRASRGKR